MPEKKALYQLKVTLKHSKPPIWRRILVPENINLYKLHEVIQASMGWWNEHLHAFRIHGQEYGNPQDDEFGERKTKNEKQYRLNRLDLAEKTSFSYEYDFGDGWEHTILLEKIVPAEKSLQYPACMAGKRACPPENVGGLWMYENFLIAIADPENEQHDQYLEWIGGKFDPEYFDLESVNEILSDMHMRHSEKQISSEEEDLNKIAEIQKAMADSMAIFMENMPSNHRERYNAISLRRDMLTFLLYLDNNRTIGTKSTGNLPLKAVYAICKNFVNPPLLEPLFGDVMHQIRTEAEVWPLVLVHNLAFQAYFVTGGQGKAWKVSAVGQQFINFPSPIQLFLLIFHWFNHVDWSIAFPFSGIGQDRLPDFTEATPIILLDLPAGDLISYEVFADDLIAQSKLHRSNRNLEYNRSNLHAIIKTLVISPMVSFGVLECEYETDQIVQNGYRNPERICLTNVGKEMLTLLRDIADGIESIHHQ